ncbi:DUF4231 domain-containing protein [Flammeovirga sp. EKP202]|uniref:DUF4231 domain-containing protein n=1 Tax=Flammeovirga sp. EKP202 TaxID=2770592 RepID=UPI00165FF295|nr:DUF4231 domain-containing protein [Flammeovirga sp. EKP202]MBD0402978.1 DUF4231 domain-containing protein [Flammeovirga sp. EKP202]
MSTTKAKYDVLFDEISAIADRASYRSQENKLKSFRIYLGIAIASALITILVAVSNDVPLKYQLHTKILTLLLSGVTTVLAAWDGFYNHKQLWINYGESRNQLRAIQLKMKMMDEQERNNDKALDTIFNEFQEVMHNGNSNWKSLRMENVDATASKE